MSTTSPPSSRPPYGIFILLFGLLLLGLFINRFYTANHISPRQALPKFNTVPPFTFAERGGRNISNTDLLGKIWVADFIFTTCPGPCPMITASMAKVQEATRKDAQVQLVTFTVDPQIDTPAVLAAYANKFGADPNRWWFLTGQEKPLYDLIQNGFYQVVQDNRGQPLQPGQFIVTHSTKMVLVDAGGDVRGFYDGVDPDGRADLLKGIKVLEKEEKQ